MLTQRRMCSSMSSTGMPLYWRRMSRVCAMSPGGSLIYAQFWMSIRSMAAVVGRRDRLRGGETARSVIEGQSIVAVTMFQPSSVFISVGDAGN